MIEKLKIIKKVDEEKTVRFDEVMDADSGKWHSTGYSSNQWTKVVETRAATDNWDYYLATDSDRYFVYFRVKK